MCFYVKMVELCYVAESILCICIHGGDGRNERIDAVNALDYNYVF